MSVLAGIVKNILVIIILASFFEILLPEGKVKPFVRFAIGLFILISVLNPALSYVFREHEVKVSMWDYTDNYMDTGEILKKGNNINEEMKKQGDMLVKEKIQGQISAVALMLPEVEDVTTEAYITEQGSLKKLHIIVRPREDEKIESEKVGVFLNHNEQVSKNKEEEIIRKKITSIIQNLYGLDENYIKIEFEGGL